MSRAPHTFRQQDVEGAVQAAKAAGVPVKNVGINLRTGAIEINVECEPQTTERGAPAAVRAVVPAGCDLYRHFGRDGVLLYVGISLSAVARLADHRSGSHWYDQIVNVTIEKFSTLEAAEIAERAAIKTEKPKYNIRDAGVA